MEKKMENNAFFSKEQSLALQKKIYAAVSEEHQPELAALYACLDYQNYSPVKRFENATGLKGIYHHYKFPQDMNPLEYEALMKPMRIFEIIERSMNPGSDDLLAELQEVKPQSLFAVRKMYQELTELNPELKEAAISPTLVRSYVAVISGACSGFPPEDIIEFSKAKGADNDRINEEKRQFSKLIEQRTGRTGANGKPLIENWCPSEKTRNRILQLLDNRDQKRTNQSFDNTGFYSFLVDRGWFND